MGVRNVLGCGNDYQQKAYQVMVTVFYWVSGTVFALYVIGVINTVYGNRYKQQENWNSLQEVRSEADRDIEVIAAKKRHPAGKRRG